MKAGISKRMAAAVAVASAMAALVVGAPSNGWAQAQADSLRAFGISSDGTLMATFTTDRPQVLDWVRAVTGLSGDTALIGIDFRVQNGLMYGVGNQGGIYTIKTPPATTDVVVTKVSQLSVPLYGTNFGVDFNPAADRLRVISDNGQNLRHNLANGTTTEDTTLTTPPATGPTRGVTAAAYTNNDLNADTATTLFDINTATDQAVIQSPANNGTLAPTGALGVDAGLNAGFDIFSDLTNGKTTSVSAFATLTSASGSATLYSVNLFTGATVGVGQFPLPITDIAIALDTN
ncbi:DUF4394 domain-containing protein [Streptomyces sp. V1I1]|uniref:DUF4394 domain-containing protein n=1 Tax=Streptomyces sp. V1I1 TaxID=3042272 RepID=UPI002784A9E7|nr:DUF4394 domain-containing protein [Streptomyces sp. V1I1]MDQ0943726.1 hypothetical protein [Streptomyces sp. V1I1]